MPKHYRRKNGRKPLTKMQYKQVAKIANKQIHKMSELKCLDGTPFDVSAVLAPADFFTGIRTKITMPAQGDGDGTRDGDSIYLRSLSINSWVDCSTTQDLLFRAILVQFAEDDATAPLLDEILDQANGASVPKRPMTSHYVCQPKTRWKILDDRFLSFNANAADVNKPYRVRLKTSDFLIKKPQFNAAALTGTGQIYLYIFADAAVAGAQFNQVQVRYRYFDN